MFIKSIPKKDKHSGKTYYYYRLCESYRIGEVPRHRTILNLGELSQVTPEQRKLLADRIEQLVMQRPGLFNELPAPIEELAKHYANIIISKKLMDTKTKQNIKQPEQATSPIKCDTDYQTVDVNSLEHKRVREIGAEWLCKQALEQLQLTSCLEQAGWDKRWIALAHLYIIGRALFPASDLKTEDWYRINSGVCECLGLDPEKITRHHLYKVSRLLYKEKERLDNYLYDRTRNLFSLQDTLYIYDLTNTYFEGRKQQSVLARFSKKSKEKRTDTRIISLAVVMNKFGFIKYSQIYPGNMADCETLEKTLEDITLHSGKTQQRVVVMDAGIATGDNLKLLRKMGYDYVCVSLSKVKDYEAQLDSNKQVILRDNEEHPITLQWIKDEKEKDHLLYVKSKDKEQTQESMNTLFCKRYEEGLQAIKVSIGKKGGIKQADKVYERIGRLKERYPSVHRWYQIDVIIEGKIATDIQWKRMEQAKQNLGVYFIRTSLNIKEEKVLWDIYNTIREVESTFRMLKTDLKIRPIFHQEDLYTEAHLYGSLLAYMVANTIRYQLKLKKIHKDWSNIVRTMNSQKVIISSFKTKTGKSIYIKKCSDPEYPVREIYEALGYRERPFWQKKSVLPEN